MTRVRRPQPARRAVLSIALAVALLGVTGCLKPAKIGARCKPSTFGSDAGWVLYCSGGRMIRGMTVQQAVEVIALASEPAPAMQGEPMRIMVAGDSTGNVFGAALWRYSRRHPQILSVIDVAQSGCPVTVVDSIRNFDGEVGQNTARCSGWPTSIPRDVGAYRPDVSLVFASMMEQADQRTGPNEPWRNVLDPAWAAHQRTDYHRLVDALTSSGGAVMWADVPVMRFWLRSRPWIADDPARTAALNDSYRQFLAERPGVEVLPLAAHLNRPGNQIDWAIRPDGIHLSEASADIEVAHWLVPILIARFRPPVPPTAS